MGYESLYPKTPPGVIEIKTLPPAHVLSAALKDDDRTERNTAFMKLFRYIQANQLAMTVPVEAGRFTGPEMRFYVESAVTNRTLPNTADVTVLEIPARTVVSIGLRGAYTRRQYEDGLQRLRTWLQAHPEWVPAGEPYAVYWNSPFTPFFLKQAEVHMPVQPASTP